MIAALVPQSPRSSRRAGGGRAPAPLCRAAARLAALAALAGASEAFYLPGVAPRAYSEGEPLQVKANSFFSELGGLKYPTAHLPGCLKGPQVKETLGEWMEGGRIEVSEYGMEMMRDVNYQEACTKSVPSAKAAAVARRVQEGYNLALILDNLPVTVYDLEGAYDLMQQGARSLGHLSKGIPYGFSVSQPEDAGAGPLQDGSRIFVHNHFVFNVLVHRAAGELGLKSTQDMLQDGASFAGLEGYLPSMPSPASPGQDSEWLVVGFEVMPCSVSKEAQERLAEEGGDWVSWCHDHDPRRLSSPDGDLDGDTWSEILSTGQEVTSEAAQEIKFSYSVVFTESDIPWTHRWDAYLYTGGSDSHFFSTINSLLVLAMLSCLVAVILVRTVRRDLALDEPLLEEEAGRLQEDFGWKLLGGDVFRAPKSPGLLAALVGCGWHMATTAGFILLLAGMGLISPAVRGGLLTTGLVAAVLSAYFGGRKSVRCLVDSTGHSRGWLGVAAAATWMAALPCFLILILLNFAIWHTGTTGGVPAWALAILFTLWLFIAFPIALLGAIHARRAGPCENPTKTNKIPRIVPYLGPGGVIGHPVFAFLFGGFLPFGVAYIELHLIFRSMFQYQAFLGFGFLLVTSIITTLVTVEVAVLGTYSTLCLENWHWQWQSWATGASLGLYLFAFGIGYLVVDLHGLHTAGGVLLYITYLSILSMLTGFAAGTVAYLGSNWFVRRIFSFAKSD